MDKIQKLMVEGWNIQIECKGKGRNFEMSYEATMTKVGWSWQEKAFHRHHAVGNTFDELADNLQATIK